jgi:Na+/H+-dicarboxylate symporter
MRTTVNVTGDCAVSCIVAKSENALDLAVFNDPDAGSVEDATRRAPTSPTTA